ncbi:MAG: CFI-box-CTERM domain-containing protein [Faecousia sp.]
MAEECSYYYYDSGYSCALKREKEGNSSIDSDTVHRYCWGYHYRDCPRYIAKNGGSSDGCFLTSACVEAKGLPDDCYELTTLRKFRDEYLAKRDCGKCEIEHYYHVAPMIVKKIKESDHGTAIFEQIYNELVLPCVKLIESSDYNGVHSFYRSYVLLLEKQYLSG